MISHPISAHRGAEVLARQHRQLVTLCDLLESIADDLPRVCSVRAARVVGLLSTLLPTHHAAEEAQLAKLLSGNADATLLDRIIAQHHEDEGLAQEIALELEPLVNGALPEDPHRLGYMLRCFFNGYRRAMLIEELALKSQLCC